jgi:hypothetical protein
MATYDIKKMNQVNNNFKKKKKTKIETNINYINVLSESMMNIVINEENLLEFKFLDIEKRLDLLNNYFEKINIDQDDKNKLIDLIKSNNLKNKTEINYDKVNKRIIKITKLEYDNINNKYFYNNKISKKKNSSKNLVNQLIK